MKNTLLDVHNMILEQMERVMDAESPEEIEKESGRAKVLTGLGKVAVDNSRVMLDAQKMIYESTGEVTQGAKNLLMLDNK